MEGTMTFDDVLDMLGGMGTFQWFLYVAYAIAAATGVESIYSNFIGNWIIYSQTYILYAEVGGGAECETKLSFILKITFYIYRSFKKAKII